MPQKYPGPENTLEYTNLRSSLEFLTVIGTHKHTGKIPETPRNIGICGTPIVPTFGRLLCVYVSLGEHKEINGGGGEGEDEA